MGFSVRLQKNAAFAAFFCVLGMLLPATSCRAALIATIQEDQVAWDASDIVLTDASGVVQEVWKGEAERGDVVPLAALFIKP